MHKNRTFHQIFLSEMSGEKLPNVLDQVSQQSRPYFIDFDYALWRDSEIRDLLRIHFDSRVIDAYETLIPLAYKADLARYCILYCHGGWYADLGVKICRNIKLDESVQFYYFHDFGIGPPGPSSFLAACQNALFYAKSGSKILEECIQQIVLNCEKRFYGLNSTCPTGPMVFGRSILNHTPSPHIIPGYFMALTPCHQQKNFSFVAPEGDIIALHKSTWHPSMPLGGDVKSLGIKGSNNYNRLWEERSIYRN